MNFVDPQHSGRGVRKHVDRGAFQLVQPRGRRDVGIHRTDDLGIETAQVGFSRSRPLLGGTRSDRKATARGILGSVHA